LRKYKHLKKGGGGQYNLSSPPPKKMVDRGFFKIWTYQIPRDLVEKGFTHLVTESDEGCFGRRFNNKVEGFSFSSLHTLISSLYFTVKLNCNLDINSIIINHFHHEVFVNVSSEPPCIDGHAWFTSISFVWESMN